MFLCNLVITSNARQPDPSSSGSYPRARSIRALDYPVTAQDYRAARQKPHDRRVAITLKLPAMVLGVALQPLDGIACQIHLEKETADYRKSVMQTLTSNGA